MDQLQIVFVFLVELVLQNLDFVLQVDIFLLGLVLRIHELNIQGMVWFLGVLKEPVGPLDTGLLQILQENDFPIYSLRTSVHEIVLKEDKVFFIIAKLDVMSIVELFFDLLEL